MNDADLASLREVFGRYPEVAGVWLFGSHAHGTASARSDVDLALDPAAPSVAVEPGGSTARDRKLDVLADLVEAGFEHVDLVVLDRDDPVLRFEAIGPNRLVYAAQGYDPAEAFAQALRRYDDTSRLRRLVREAYFEGLEGDDVFERRTRRFAEILGILERLADTPWERFSTDPEKYGSIERFLQLAVEALDDLGAHVVARARIGSVTSYADVPARLLEAGHLTEAQARTWRRIIGFRNVLVHDYLEVDLGIVYDVLQNRLEDLRDLHRTLLAAHRCLV